MTNRQVFNPVIMSYQARAATVRDNHELLGADAGRSTRHLEVALPSGTSYQAGDHLGVLPRNNINLIRRVMVRFGLDAGSYVTIIPNRGSHTHLPTDEPAPLLGVLGSCVELQDPATRGDIEVMARLHQLIRSSGRRSRAWSVPTTNHKRGSATRCWPVAVHCSTCSTTIRPATCRSRSSSIACHPCGPVTTPSPPHRW